MLCTDIEERFFLLCTFCSRISFPRGASQSAKILDSLTRIPLRMDKERDPRFEGHILPLRPIFYSGGNNILFPRQFLNRQVIFLINS